PEDGHGPLRHERRSRAEPGFFVVAKEASDRLDVRSLLSLGALGDFEAHLLTFLQRLDPRHVDRREVGEQIFAAAIGRNKTEALRVVEPFNRSSWHVFQSKYQEKKSGRARPMFQSQGQESTALRQRPNEP